MKRIEIFDEKVDFVVVPAFACLAIYMFYGATAAILAFIAILATAHFKPLQQQGFTRDQLTVMGAAVVLTFSLFLRSFFLDAYYSSAPWAVNAEMREYLGLRGPCFIRGGYLQYMVDDSWRSVLRDSILPLGGLLLLFYSFPRGQTRRNGILIACLLLMFGLWLNTPLSHREAEAAEITAVEDARQKLTPSAQANLPQQIDAGQSSKSPETTKPTTLPTPQVIPISLGALSDDELTNYVGASCAFSKNNRWSIVVALGSGVINIDGTSQELVDVPSDYNMIYDGGQFKGGDLTVKVSPANRISSSAGETSTRLASVHIKRGTQAAAFTGEWNCGA